MNPKLKDPIEYYRTGIENRYREKFLYSFSGPVPALTSNFLFCSFKTISREGSIQAFRINFVNILPPPGSYNLQIYFDSQRIPESQDLQGLSISDVLGEWVEYNKYFDMTSAHIMTVLITNNGVLPITPTFIVKGHYQNDL